MSAAVLFRSLSFFLSQLWKMFVHSHWSCDQDLIKQKVKIIDFQTSCNSVDYAIILDKFHLQF